MAFHKKLEKRFLTSKDFIIKFSKVNNKKVGSLKLDQIIVVYYAANWITFNPKHI